MRLGAEDPLGGRAGGANTASAAAKTARKRNRFGSGLEDLAILARTDLKG